MYKCYLEVPKVNRGQTKAFPECSAMRLCYESNGISFNPKGNVCMEDWLKIYTDAH